MKNRVILIFLQFSFLYQPIAKAMLCSELLQPKSSVMLNSSYFGFFGASDVLNTRLLGYDQRFPKISGKSITQTVFEESKDVMTYSELLSSINSSIGLGDQIKSGKVIFLGLWVSGLFNLMEHTNLQHPGTYLLDNHNLEGEKLRGILDYPEKLVRYLAKADANVIFFIPPNMTDFSIGYRTRNEFLQLINNERLLGNTTFVFGGYRFDSDGSIALRLDGLPTEKLQDIDSSDPQLR